MKKQPIIYNLLDPQYENIEEKLKAEEIAEEEKFDRRKDEKYNYSKVEVIGNIWENSELLTHSPL